MAADLVTEAGIRRSPVIYGVRRTEATFAARSSQFLESGVELRIIRVLLGHSDLSSTTRYAQVATHLIANTPSPFDRLSLVVIPPE